jgi:predicted DNA-binding transcriptional regulator AlpA
MKIILQIDAESKKEFESMIKEVVTKVLNESLPKVNGTRTDFEPEDQLMTREEVMKMLNVSHSTLYHYQRKEIIPFLKIGNRVYFKKKDILNNIHLEGNPYDHKAKSKKSKDKFNWEDDED